MRAEMRRQNRALVGLSWEGARWRVCTFCWPVHGHAWPLIRCMAKCTVLIWGYKWTLVSRQIYNEESAYHEDGLHILSLILWRILQGSTYWKKSEAKWECHSLMITDLVSVWFKISLFPSRYSAPMWKKDIFTLRCFLKFKKDILVNIYNISAY